MSKLPKQSLWLKNSDLGITHQIKNSTDKAVQLSHLELKNITSIDLVDFYLKIHTKNSDLLQVYMFDLNKLPYYLSSSNPNNIVFNFWNTLLSPMIYNVYQEDDVWFELSKLNELDNNCGMLVNIQFQISYLLEM